MNKIIPFFLFITSLSFAQTSRLPFPFDSLLAKGKAEFKKDFDEQNFQTAVSYLERAVAIEPEHVEAHYFLGYAYSRMNAKDANGIIEMRLDLVERSSKEFETVNKLSSEYRGEYVVLGPYMKITSEWGSLALNYFYKNQADSVQWAFAEGKRRGGFCSFFLELNRYILSQCSKNAILFISGDHPTMHLFYLQQKESYRKDVKIINTDLLNTVWYPHLLHEKLNIEFNQPVNYMDTIFYKPWKDSVISIRNKYAIKDFSWNATAGYHDGYLQRSELLILSILQENKFESDVFFLTTIDEKNLIGLTDHFLDKVMVNELNVNNKAAYDFKYLKAKFLEVLKKIKVINKNSRDERLAVYAIKHELLLRLEDSHRNGRRSEVKQWLKLLDDYVPDSEYPMTEETNRYIRSIRKQY